MMVMMAVGGAVRSPAVLVHRLTNCLVEREREREEERTIIINFSFFKTNAINAEDVNVCETKHTSKQLIEW